MGKYLQCLDVHVVHCVEELRGAKGVLSATGIKFKELERVDASFWGRANDFNNRFPGLLGAVRTALAGVPNA